MTQPQRYTIWRCPVCGLQAREMVSEQQHHPVCYGPADGSAEHVETLCDEIEVVPRDARLSGHLRDLVEECSQFDRQLHEQAGFGPYAESLTIIAARRALREHE